MAVVHVGFEHLNLAPESDTLHVQLSQRASLLFVFCVLFSIANACFTIPTVTQRLFLKVSGEGGAIGPMS